MLKKYLLTIGIITIALALSGNTFGQNNKQKSAKNARITKRPTQATGGTIPVFWDIKSPAKRKGVPANHSFQSQTQPFADGRVKGKTKTSRKLPTKPVRNLEQSNGGMDTADEAPAFGERNAKPKDLVKNNPEAKPALLEFQIPEKIVTDNKYPEIENQRTINKPQPRQNSLDGKGTDVNVEEIDYLRKSNRKPKVKKAVVKRKTH